MSNHAQKADELPIGHPNLVAEIAADIRASGPITFARFMELALYHPEFGYYMRATEPEGERIGWDGDYYTSFDVHPILAQALARQIRQVDERLGSLLAGLDPSATLVVVTGDHGEALFDAGTIAHSSRLSDAQTRVPLVLTGPGIARGAGRRGPTDHADVLPTLLARVRPR